MTKNWNSAVPRRSKFLQSRLHRPADLHLVGDGAKLGLDRFVDFVGDDTHRLGNRKARAQAAHHQLDRVRKALGELVDPALDQLADHEMGQAEASAKPTGTASKGGSPLNISNMMRVAVSPTDTIAY